MMGERSDDAFNVHSLCEVIALTDEEPCILVSPGTSEFRVFVLLRLSFLVIFTAIPGHRKIMVAKREISCLDLSKF